jgi:hypothetical protein
MGEPGVVENGGGFAAGHSFHVFKTNGRLSPQ